MFLHNNDGKNAKNEVFNACRFLFGVFDLLELV